MAKVRIQYVTKIIVDQAEGAYAQGKNEEMELGDGEQEQLYETVEDNRKLRLPAGSRIRHCGYAQTGQDQSGGYTHGLPIFSEDIILVFLLDAQAGCEKCVRVHKSIKVRPIVTQDK